MHIYISLHLSHQAMHDPLHFDPLELHRLWQKLNTGSRDDICISSVLLPSKAGLKQCKFPPVLRYGTQGAVRPCQLQT